MPQRPIDRSAKITGDTATHAEYGVGPATDYALPAGAWVIAPESMTLTLYRSATGGWSIQGSGSVGWNFQHLVDGSRRSGYVAEGTPIAQIAGAGDSPGTAWTGPHLHSWVNSARGRRSVEEHFADLGFTPASLGATATPTLTGTAGGGTTPFTPDLTEEDDIMSIRVIAHITDEGATEEVALVSPFFPDGYLIAKGSTETAAGWLRTYSPTLNGVPHAKLNRDQYLGAITAAKTTRAGYVRGLPAAVTIPPIEIPPIEVGEVTVTGDPEVRRLLGELLAAVAAPRTTTVG